MPNNTPAVELTPEELAECKRLSDAALLQFVRHVYRGGNPPTTLTERERRGGDDDA